MLMKTRESYNYDTLCILLEQISTETATFNTVL